MVEVAAPEEGSKVMSRGGFEVTTVAPVTDNLAAVVLLGELDGCCCCNCNAA